MCRGCKAKDAHIESLEKQLDFFRGQLAPRQPFTQTFPDTEPDITTGHSLPIMEELPWVSEEEEELLAMKQAGLIDPTDVKRALEQVGALSTEIDFG